MAHPDPPLESPLTMATLKLHAFIIRKSKQLRAMCSKKSKTLPQIKSPLIEIDHSIRKTLAIN